MLNDDLMQYDFIHSVRYREKIAWLSKDLKSRIGFSNFCICIIDNLDSHKYMMSNMPDWAIDYYELGGYRSDKVFCREYVQGKREFFPRLEDYDYIQNLLVTQEEKQYSYFDLYALVRTSYECTFIVLALDDNETDDVKTIFKQTHKAFESFIVDFLMQTVNEIRESCIFFDRLLPLQNKKYLERVMISSRKIVDLTPAEEKILCLCKEQLSAKEMALKTGLSEKTIRNNFLALKEKLGVFSTKDLSKEAYIRGY